MKDRTKLKLLVLIGLVFFLVAFSNSDQGDLIDKSSITDDEIVIRDDIDYEDVVNEPQEDVTQEMEEEFVHDINFTGLDRVRSAVDKFLSKDDGIDGLSTSAPSGWTERGPVLIDDDGSDGITWNQAKNTPWCEYDSDNDIYVIGELEIDGTLGSGDGLEIRDSSENFVIISVNIYSADQNGLYIHDVTADTTIFVVDVDIQGSDSNGIRIDDVIGIPSTNIAVTGSIIGYSGGDGIDVTDTSDVHIGSVPNLGGGNTIFRNDEYGIWLDGDGNENDGSITDNDIYYNSYGSTSYGGIYVDTWEDVIITNNEIEADDEGFGVGLDDVDGNSHNENAVVNNVIKYSGSDGLITFGCSVLTVAQNDIHHNDGDGIQMDACNDVIIAENEIYNNTGSGLYGSGGNAWIVSSNTFDYNGGYGMFITGSITNSDVMGNQFTNNTNTGMHVTSVNGNFTLGNAALDNGGHGFYIAGYENALEFFVMYQGYPIPTISSSNGGDGFFIDSTGTGNLAQFSYIISTDNGGHGIRYRGTGSNDDFSISTGALYGNDGDAVRVESCDGITLQGQEIMVNGSGGDGFNIRGSSNIHMESLLVEDCGGGIRLDTVDTASISYSAVINSGYGITVDGNPNLDVEISDSFIQNCASGMFIEDVLNGASLPGIHDNVILGTRSGYGMTVSIANGVDVIHNFINDTSGDGMVLGSLISSVIRDNFIMNSGGNGVKATGSHFNAIFYGNFIINGSAGDGADTSTDTSFQWYNATSQEGNWWSDYGGTDYVAPWGVGDAPHVLGTSKLDLYPYHGPAIFKDGKDQSPLYIDGNGMGVWDGTQAGNFEWLKIRWWNAYLDYLYLWEYYYNETLLSNALVQSNPLDPNAGELHLMGNGSARDPYLLHDLFINGGGSESCLSVVNQRSNDRHFTIQNCYLGNSGGMPGQAGLFIENVSLGMIQQLFVFENGGEGMYLRHAKNMTLTQLNAFNNTKYGFRLENASDCTILTMHSGTDVDQQIENAGNELGGMILIGCHNNTMTDVVSWEDANVGMWLINCSGNEYANLAALDTTGLGMRIEGSAAEHVTNFISQQNAGRGLELVFTENVTIQQGSIIFNGLDGCFIANSSGVWIEQLNISDNEGYGILMKENVNRTTVVNNDLYRNDGTGIHASESQFVTIDSNRIKYSEDHGIWIRYCNMTVIMFNTIDESFDYGMYSFNCNFTTLHGNDVYRSFKDGAYIVGGTNLLVEDNDLISNRWNGMYVEEVQGAEIINRNHFDSNKQDGLRMENCNNATLIRTYASSNLGHGIHLLRDDGLPWTDHDRSNHHEITSTSANGNGGDGIHLYQCNYTVIKDSLNLIYNARGIGTAHCFWINITGNWIRKNFEGGINIYHDFYDYIWDNIIEDNDGYGLMLEDRAGICDIWDNTFRNNEYGVQLRDEQTSMNMFWLNRFEGNGMNAKDNGLFNYWDNGTVGNWWSDYNGYDLDGDGIGFTPYIISKGDVRFGGTGYGYPKNDSYPLTDRKDTFAPDITIHFPSNFDPYEITAPTFNITVDEYVIDYMWYTIGGGNEVYNYSWTGTLFYSTWEDEVENAEWIGLTNGTWELTFHARDIKGNVGSATVLINKDTLDPVITVISPQTNDPFGNEAPAFELSVVEGNLEDTWYYLDNGTLQSINYSSSLSDTVAQVAWDVYPDGFITIRFYANDSLGHVSWNDVVVVKDTTVPEIFIIDPENGEIYTDEYPRITIIKVGTLLGDTWYTMDGGNTNYTFTSTIFTVDNTAWNDLNDGEVTIRVYITNLVGVSDYDEITVEKITTSVAIFITSPNPNDEFAAEPPVIQLNLITNTTIDQRWYTINGDATRYHFTGINFTVDQAKWASFSDDTEVTITVYANTTFGVLSSESITVIKDFQAGETTVWEDIWNFIMMIISLILGFFGLGAVFLWRRRSGKKERCTCIGKNDCACDAII